MVRHSSAMGQNGTLDSTVKMLMAHPDYNECNDRFMAVITMVLCPHLIGQVQVKLRSTVLGATFPSVIKIAFYAVTLLETRKCEITYACDSQFMAP